MKKHQIQQAYGLNINLDPDFAAGVFSIFVINVIM